jgi:hypothetical protein
VWRDASSDVTKTETSAALIARLGGEGGGGGGSGDYSVADYGADPTGTTDSREAIQDAIDACHLAGGGVVYIPPGSYRINQRVGVVANDLFDTGDDKTCTGGIQMRSNVWLKGAGNMATILFPGGSWTAAKEPAVIAVGDGDTSRAVYKCKVSDLCIQNMAAQYPSPSLTSSTWWNDNVNAIMFNVDRGSEANVTHDSDGRQMFDNILIHNLRHGVWLKGPVRDTGWTGNLYELQSVYMTRIRVHNVMRSGFTFGQRGTQGGGGNDSFVAMCEVGSFNNGTGLNYAGFEIHCGSITFTQCKSWYGKRHTALTGTSYQTFAAAAGAGFWLAGSNIAMVDCQAQDDGGHGFWIAGERNQLSTCKVDSQAPEEDILFGTADEAQHAAYYLSSNYASTGDNTVNFSHVLTNCVVGSEGAVAFDCGFLFHDHMVNCTLIGGLVTSTPDGSAILGYETIVDAGTKTAYRIPDTCDIIGLAEYRTQNTIDWFNHTTLRQYATADLPSASSSGPSAVVWDKTLGKPVWSNGSTWVTWT